MNSDQLKKWLLSEGRREALKLPVIERELGIPKTTLNQWLTGHRSLPEAHLQPLVDYFKRFDLTKQI